MVEAAQRPGTAGPSPRMRCSPRAALRQVRKKQPLRHTRPHEANGDRGLSNPFRAHPGRRAVPGQAGILKSVVPARQASLHHRLPAVLPPGATPRMRDKGGIIGSSEPTATLLRKPPSAPPSAWVPPAGREAGPGSQKPVQKQKPVPGRKGACGCWQVLDCPRPCFFAALRALLLAGCRGVEAGVAEVGCGLRGPSVLVMDGATAIKQNTPALFREPG